MSKVNADLYIVFAGEQWEWAGGCQDSFGVFNRLVDAKTFCTLTGSIERNWWEHRKFDTLTEAQEFDVCHKASGGNGCINFASEGKTWYRITHKRGTLAQVYGEIEIATIKNGQLVLCSIFDEKDGWEDV